MTTPPHLPPESWSVPAYYIRRSAPWIVIIILLSILSGVSAALAIIAWGIPEGNMASFSDRILLRRTVAPETLDEAVVNHVTTRMFDVYDTSNQTRYNTLAPNAFIGRAMLLSSDGWAVFFAPKPVKAESIVMVDMQGMSYMVEEVVVDSTTNLTYAHVTGNGFRVAAFSDLASEPSVAWAFTEEKQTTPVRVLPPRFTAQTYTTISLGEPTVLPVVEEVVVPGTVITDDRGEVLGVVGNKQVLYPAWMLEKQVRQVISNRTIAYPNFGIEGTLVALSFDDGVATRAPSMLVTSVARQARAAEIQVGDRITRVNGVPLSFDTLSEQLLQTTEVRVTVDRNGQEIPVTLRALP